MARVAYERSIISLASDPFTHPSFLPPWQLGLWRGDLSLQNLRLRDDALERLVPLTPLALHEGFIGHLHLQVSGLSYTVPVLVRSAADPDDAFHLVLIRQIPWGSLTTGRARLVVKNVKLCLQPRDIGLGQFHISHSVDELKHIRA